MLVLARACAEDGVAPNELKLQSMEDWEEKKKVTYEPGK